MNPCIDVEYVVRGFVYGGLNRVELRSRVGAGKAVNVACELAKLGANVLCIGVNYEENGDLIEQRLRDAGAAYDFVTLPGRVRENIKMYDENGVMTEINTAGDVGGSAPKPPQGEIVSPLDPSQIGKARTRLSYLGGGLGETFSKVSPKEDLLVISGSLPVGLSDAYYRDVIQSWSGRVVLDCAGEPLRLALGAEKLPYAVKPNLYELNTTFGVEAETPPQSVAICNRLMSHIPVVCVSMGEQGAVLVAEGRSFFADAPQITPKRLHGAGDAMVAGLAYAISQGRPVEEYLPAAIAQAAKYMS
jgi:1-phosphofructokinase